MSDRLPSDGKRPRGLTFAQVNAYSRCVSGSYDPPGQPVPPWQQPATSVATGPSALLTTAGVNSGPSLYLDAICIASARSAGVKSISSSMDVPVRPYAGGLVGIGCVGEYFSPG